MQWLRKERTRNLDRPICVYAALIYATSILSYLRNRDYYSTEAIFHQELIENPHQCLTNLCSKLGLDSSNAENILLPFNAEVSLLITLWVSHRACQCQIVLLR